MFFRFAYTTAHWALLAGFLTVGLLRPALAGSPAALFGASSPGSAGTVDHSTFDRLLKAYTSTGTDGIARVAYARFKSEGHAALKAYITTLEATAVGTLDRPEQFAYWANLYNAKTLDIVLSHYPVASIKDISLGGGLLAAVTGGPWKAKVLKVGGVELSLDDIEHGILRPIFKDPRIHYAVNCASLGCPNIGPEAFTGARLEEQLDRAARAFVNHPRGARATPDGLVVSSIYSWFIADFGGTDAAVIAHLRRYGNDTLVKALQSFTEIADHAYDWQINDTGAVR